MFWIDNTRLLLVFLLAIIFSRTDINAQELSSDTDLVLVSVSSYDNIRIGQTMLEKVKQAADDCDLEMMFFESDSLLNQYLLSIDSTMVKSIVRVGQYFVTKREIGLSDLDLENPSLTPTRSTIYFDSRARLTYRFYNYAGNILDEYSYDGKKGDQIEWIEIQSYKKTKKLFQKYLIEDK